MVGGDGEPFDSDRWRSGESRAVNLAHWEERVPAHVASPDYGVDEMIADPQRLSSTVRFDLPRLGSVTGVRGVHLQCHFGTDTVSLSRLGATMVGLDFSAEAVRAARGMVARSGDDVGFVLSDVYDAVEELGAERFDLVYSGIGALCWLPDISRWAGVVADLLAPGGRLFLREAHPMLWALDDSPHDRRLVVEYPYFEVTEPTRLEEPGTYVQTDAEFTHNATHSWNHGLGQIVTALLARGMTITMLEEHDSVPWDAIPGLMDGPVDGEYRLFDRPWRLPLTYTLHAVKPPLPHRTR